MSIIIKNGHKTIATLSSFTISGQTYYCCGIVPSGTYWALPLHSSDAMRVLISATVNASTRGYLFGDERFSIQFNSSNQVVWSYNGGSISVALELGAHTYGFIDGRPFYDGELLINETITANATENVCYLASANNPDPTPLSNAKIKRVEIYGHETNATDSKKIWSYYATKNGTTGYLVEKWSNSIVTNTGGSIGSDVKYITYGIGINDLRNAVNTSYHDLVAIYTQDGGAVSPNYYAPEVVVNDSDSTDTHDMAFRWIGRSLPRGYTKQTHPVYDTDSKGVDGELLLGRQPKWNMWADNVNMGRYISGFSYDLDSIRQARVRFNPLVDKYGQDKGYFRLEDWENYSPTLYHKPDLRVGNLQGQEIPNFTMEFVNELPASTRTGFYISDKEVTSITGRAIPVIKYTRLADIEGELTFVLGNLVSWHEDCSYYDGYDATGSPIPIPIYGGYYSVRIGASPDDTSNALCGLHLMVGWDAENEDSPLGINSPATTKYKYRDGGITVEPSLYRLGDNTISQIKALAGSTGKIQCYAEFGLLIAPKNSTTAYETGVPALSTMISASRITPLQNVEVTLEDKVGYYTFVQGMDSSLSLICDSSGHAACLPVHTNNANMPDELVLPLLVTDDNGDYVARTVKANLTLYMAGNTEVVEEKTSISQSTWAGNQNNSYAHWFGEGDHYAYKDGVRVLSDSINSLITNSTAQFLVWDMNDIPYECKEQNSSGYWKFKENISFKIDITEIGGEPIVTTLTFTINGHTYDFVDGMTWETWVGTIHNTGGFYVSEGYISVNIEDLHYDVKVDSTTFVYAEDVIESREYFLGEGYRE